jgi:hypothetical protein
MVEHKRKIKLIKPQLQLRLTLVFIGFAALSLLMQFSLFAAGLTRAAVELPSDSAIMVESAASLLWQALWTSLILFLPLTFAVGILTTFRFAGPIYRFELFLNQVLHGEKPGDCTIRKGDQLQDFCELLNKVTEPLRQQDSADGCSTEESPISLVKDAEPIGDTQPENGALTQELGEAG